MRSPLSQLIVYARISVLVALGVSAVLVADHFRPGPSFCPLEEACDKAAESPLGSVAGIPTSILGASAFAVLLLLTLPSRGLGRTLRAAGGCLCVAVGTALFLYQAFVLKSFCPLCVVVDVAAIVGGGIIVLNAVSRPVYDWHDRESIGSKIAWTMLGFVVCVAPFAMPQEEVPTYEEAVPLADEDLEPLEILVRAASPQRKLAEAPAALESPTNAVVEPSTASLPAPPPPPPPPALDDDDPETSEAAAALLVNPEPDEPVVAIEITPEPPPPPTPAPATTPAPKPDPEPAPKPQPRVLIVEYLNAYCPHCRKSHQRLDKVLAELNVEVKRRRIYTWSSDEYPLWARACMYARQVGKEEELFRALMETKSQKRSEVFRAARRVGLDARALQQFVNEKTPPAELVRDRKLARKARLKGLPTFDIGRRRLMGQQSERALRDAIRAAADNS